MILRNAPERLLEGVRVLELARVLAGPFCGQLLADAGAVVTKVEPPGGDDTRRWGPPFLPGCEPGPDQPGDSAYFTSCNRGKRSIALDLGKEEARDVLRALVREADVVVDNYLPGTLERWGLGADELCAELNPRLIWVSITGYHQGGPDAARPGYDFIIQAESGLMSVTGEADGRPMKVGIPISDLSAGASAAFGAVAALVARGRTGRGARLNVSLLENQAFWLANVAANALADQGAESRRYGNAHPNVVPYEIFQAADGDLAVGVGNDAQFRRLAEALGHPEWAVDARFATNAARVEHRTVLVELIDRTLARAGAGHWLTVLAAASIPVSRVRTVDEALAGQGAAGLLGSFEHPVAGAQPYVPSPFGAVAGEGSPPPRFSEHAHEILADAGYDPEARLQLIRSGAVVGPRELEGRKRRARSVGS